MDRVPLEVIYRHAFRECANYFAEKIEQRRKSGYVPVLIEDFYESLYFSPCNKNGYPETFHLQTLELPRLEAVWTMDQIPPTTEITCYKVSIQIEKPLLMQRYDFNDYPVVFMWSGKKLGKEVVPVEELNVQELMRVAQAAIKNREGLVIDEALKNKIYK